MLKIISVNTNGIRAAARKGFFDWLKTSKVSAGQQTKLMAGDVKGLDAILELVVKIQSAKNDIIDQLDNQDAEVRASIGDMPGGEGYVLTHPDGPMKLVNRAGFTAANRAAIR